MSGLISGIGRQFDEHGGQVAGFIRPKDAPNIEFPHDHGNTAGQCLIVVCVKFCWRRVYSGAKSTWIP